MKKINKKILGNVNSKRINLEQYTENGLAIIEVDGIDFITIHKKARDGMTWTKAQRLEINEMKNVIAANSVAIKQNRKAIGENRKAIEENRKAIEENRKAIVALDKKVDKRFDQVMNVFKLNGFIIE